MDVATPTSDCLTLIYDLLSPVILNGRGKSTLSHQEVDMVSFFFLFKFSFCNLICCLSFDERPSRHSSLFSAI